MPNFNQPHESVEKKGVHDYFPNPRRIPPSPLWTVQDETLIQPDLLSIQSGQSMLDYHGLIVETGKVIPNSGPMPTPPPTSPAVAQDTEMVYRSQETVYHDLSDLRAMDELQSQDHLSKRKFVQVEAPPQRAFNGINEESSVTASPTTSDRTSTTHVEQVAPNAYVVVPKIQPPDFPHVKAALSVVNTSNSSPHFRSLPHYDYCFTDPDGTPINFTAVEILVFLPRLYINQQMAWRLVCNGISNPAHFEIVKAHRYWDECLDNISVISNGYLDALRGHGWRHNKPPPANMWSRKGHQTPADWDSKDISVNGFVPDRVLEGYGHQQPPSVRFAALLHGVKKIPKGADAADLTRAIDYAVGNRWTDSFGIGQEFMFPDHLSYILNTIGRTQVTPDHLDGAVGSRYEAALRQAKNEKRKEERQAQKVEEEQTAAAEAAAAFQQQASANRTSPARQPEDFQPLDLQPSDAYRDLGLQEQHDQQFAPPHPEMFQYAPAQHYPLPSQEYSFYQDLSQAPPAPLMRDDPIPADHDFSESARIVRFAQRSDQIHIDWRWETEHVGQIMSIVEQEWVQWAQMQFAPVGAPGSSCRGDPAMAGWATYAPMTNEEYQDLFGTPIETVIDLSEDPEATGSIVID